MKILELLKQRRIWIVILGAIAFVLPFIGITPSVDPQGAIDLIVNFFTAIYTLVVTGLALWSYFKPKK